MEIRDSNWATEVLAILEASRIFSRSFRGSLIVESDSSNAISRVNHNVCKPGKLHFYFNEIKSLVSCLQFVFRDFHQVLRSANGLVDTSAKQGVDWVVPWEGLL